jgi:hypothetical protein
MPNRKMLHWNNASVTRNDARPAAAEALPPSTVGGEQIQGHTPPVKPCPARQVPALTRDSIAERAQAIWLKRGCPRDRDVENWREAEAQLKIELGIAQGS